MFTTINKAQHNDYEATIAITGTAYNSKHLEATKTLTIDAREHVYIVLSEYRPETNHTSTTSIFLSREQWDELKAEILKTGGYL